MIGLDTNVLARYYYIDDEAGIDLADRKFARRAKNLGLAPAVMVLV